jgi:hypothetical protein
MKKQKSVRKNKKIRRNKNKTRRGGSRKTASIRNASSTKPDDYIPTSKIKSSNRRSFSERFGKMCNTASCRTTRNVIPHNNQGNDISDIYDNTNPNNNFTENNPLKLKKQTMTVPSLNLATVPVRNDLQINNNTKSKGQMEILMKQLQEKENPYVLPPLPIQKIRNVKYELTEGESKDIIDRLTEKLNAQENILKHNQQEIIKSQQNKVFGKIKISEVNKRKFEEYE